MTEGDGNIPGTGREPDASTHRHHTAEVTGESIHTAEHTGAAGPLIVLELLARDAPAARFDVMLERARRSGRPAAEVAALARAVTLAHSIRETTGRHRERDATLAALVDTAHDLTSTHDLDALLRMIVRRARRLLAFDMVYITLHRADGHSYVRTSDGETRSYPVGQVIGPGEGLGGIAEQRRAPVWTSDYLADRSIGHTDASSATARAENLRAVVAVPLRHGDSTLGVLYGANRAGRTFTSDEIAALLSLADLAAVACEKAGLLERTLDEVSALERFGSTTHANLTRVRHLWECHARLSRLVLDGAGVEVLTRAIADALDGELRVHDPGGRIIASSHPVPDRDVPCVAAAVGSASDPGPGSGCVRPPTGAGAVPADARAGRGPDPDGAPSEDTAVEAPAAPAREHRPDPVGGAAADPRACVDRWPSDASVLRTYLQARIARRAVELPPALDAPEPAAPVWVAPISAGAEDLGMLALRPNEPLTEEDVLLFEQAALTVAALLLIQRGAAAAEGPVRDELLRDLLDRGHHTDQNLRERSRRLGVDLDVPHVLVLTRPEGGSLGKAAAWAGAFVHRMSGLKAVRRGCVVLLLPGSDPSLAARQVSAELGPLLGTAVSTGAAGPTKGAGSVATVYEEAVRCLDALTALHGVGGTASLDELGFLGLLLSADHDVDSFIAGAIGPVVDYDEARFTELTRTLDAYFESGGSPTHAAEALHVHPNTVHRRLERIADLLGEGWQRPEQALEIQMALRLRKTRDVLHARRTDAPSADGALRGWGGGPHG
ncbi:helix-turn-helix domain-containing protein [Streptomyces sp. BI20]|uniref:helix-turn-helix domain-containing protein n=1 Tax=Streptomyces sp. BI20 TaxID=3403460 RepID=UPI003C7414CE